MGPRPRTSSGDLPRLHIPEKRRKKRNVLATSHTAQERIGKQNKKQQITINNKLQNSPEQTAGKSQPCLQAFLSGSDHLGALLSLLSQTAALSPPQGKGLKRKHPSAGVPKSRRRAQHPASFKTLWAGMAPRRDALRLIIPPPRTHAHRRPLFAELTERESPHGLQMSALELAS